MVQNNQKKKRKRLNPPRHQLNHRALKSLQPSHHLLRKRKHLPPEVIHQLVEIESSDICFLENKCELNHPKQTAQKCKVLKVGKFKARILV